MLAFGLRGLRGLRGFSPVYAPGHVFSKSTYLTHVTGNPRNLTSGTGYAARATMLPLGCPHPNRLGS